MTWNHPLPNRYPIKQVGIQNLKKYLNDRGWKEEPFGREEVIKFKSPRPIRENIYLEIFIPSKRDLIDYTQAIEIALEAIAAFERRTFEDVLSQVLIFGDLLKVQISTPKTKTGSIPINQGILLYERVNDLLVYSACAEISIEKVVSRKLKEAMEFVENCLIEQSQYGSFIAKIHSQLERPQQRALFGGLTAPFGRKTILRILRGLKNVEDSIQEKSPDPIVNNYREGLNANMCDTLVDIVRIGLGNDLKFSTSLEPVIPIPDDIRTDTSLHPSSEGYLRDAADILKGEITKEKRELTGYVFQLRREPGEEGEKERIIRIFALGVEEKVLPVTIRLDDQSYRLAIDAHRDSKMIKIRGILEKVRRTWYLKEPEGLRIAEEDYEFDI
jgi:hypothetical protein